MPKPIAGSSGTPSAAIAARRQAADGREQHRGDGEAEAERAALAAGGPRDLRPEHEGDAGESEHATDDEAAADGDAEQRRRAQAVEQRRGRVADRDQARGDEALGVIDADVGDAVEKGALQRQRGMGGKRKAQPLAAPEREGDDAAAGDEKAYRHAELRRQVGELVGDRMPGRAPDQDAAGEQLPGLEAVHGPVSRRRCSPGPTGRRAGSGPCLRRRSRSCRR